MENTSKECKKGQDETTDDKVRNSHIFDHIAFCNFEYFRQIHHCPIFDQLDSVGNQHKQS